MNTQETMNFVFRINDLIQLRKLNLKNKRLWENGNNNSNLYEKNMKQCQKLFEKAKLICKKNKWIISVPGLYWIIEENNIDITLKGI